MRNDNLIAEARERFIKETTEHEMTVLHDDGLYRHLRFKKPGTAMYYFDLVTWPGHLTITGDCGSFHFARDTDMFGFFTAAGRDQMNDPRFGINPQYWSEKLQSPKPDGAERYSYEVYVEHVNEWLEETVAEMTLSEDDKKYLDADEIAEVETEIASLRAAVADQLLSDYSDAVHSEHEAHRLLQDFEHGKHRLYDTWEWDLREYDWQFLWCCWAIVWGIQQYRAETESRQPSGVRTWVKRLFPGTPATATA